MATFVLVPGFWLGGWAWREVTADLRRRGHDVYAVTLTGVADRAHLAGPEVGPETHTSDLTALIEAEELRDVVLVGHSGGGMPVTQAADRMPDRIARVVYVESGPLPDGVSQFDANPPEEQERLRARIGDGHLLPPPAWEPAEDPQNLAGLDDGALALLRRRSTGHPLGAATDPVRRTGGRPVPTALVACTFPVEVVTAMIAEGHPFFAGLAGAELHGLPTGHWPMLSEPKALADLLETIARG
ncbi:Pimeloyl-ACP methyl ester carboxylesterase [Micromonospora purpureochromogenes]|uniref:Pimeloyl-ACP methyl ester carboxylesterase n=1 Tax=Micromonospora purpureochromogenes TaxID=47872 RepID=A0A1C4ZD00_9ACTN|nr:alpha/beta hydrolase [Micromonospora purpureochromogenes]SCF30862.1 Pimeloyl-ACP methyl ester carboxylesterase [Micromonospora purpureochromogenes]